MSPRPSSGQPERLCLLQFAQRRFAKPAGPRGLLIMLSAKGKWFVLTSLLTLVTFGIAGCRGFFVNAKQNGVTVSPSTLNLQVAGSQQLTASATFDDNSTPKNVTGSSTWTSGDTQHVSVSSTGVVTGVATTTTPVTITATDNGFTGTSSVTVGATTIAITCNACTSGN